MTAPQSTPELSREQIERLLQSNFDGAPVVFFTVPAQMRELCDLAMRTLKAEAELAALVRDGTMMLDQFAHVITAQAGESVQCTGVTLNGEDMKMLVATMGKREGWNDFRARTIIFALETGMRAGEIAGLREVSGHVAYLVDTKNGEAREVPLSSKAIEVWGAGINLSAGSISALFARLCADAGIKGLTFHDLRHLACTRLAEKLTMLELCKMMGWKDPRHAMIYYNKTTSDIADKLQ